MVVLSLMSMFLFVGPIPVDMCMEIDVSEAPSIENGPTQSIEMSSVLFGSWGACCLDDGDDCECQATSEATCDTLGGDWHEGGGFTACATYVGCCGVCCLPPDGLCNADRSDVWCEDFGGIWLGPGSVCSSGTFCHCCCYALANGCGVEDPTECAENGGEEIICPDWPPGCNGGPCS